jgi:hypothetical protein
MTGGDGLTDEIPELDTELLDDILLDDALDDGDER